MEDLTGRTIREYAFVRLLGSGGVGQVWLAYKQGAAGFRTPVAIKLLKNPAPARRTRLIDEARLLALLNHPRIVKVHEVWHDDTNVYVVMHLVPGETMSTLVDTHGPLPQRAALELLVQLCKGLHACHTATDPNNTPLRMTHRDVKPGNIMLSQAGEMTLLDFGYAKWQGRHAHTIPDQIHGTPRYMAPEQFGVGGEIDHRADVFAAGAVLFFLLTGRHLFEGESLIDVSKNIIQMQDRSTMPRRLNHQRLSQEAREIILMCIASHPGERYQHAEALERDVSALARASDGLDLATWATHHVPPDASDLTPAPLSIFAPVVTSIQKASRQAAEAVPDLPPLSNTSPNTWRILATVAGGALLVLIGTSVTFLTPNPVTPPSLESPTDAGPTPVPNLLTGFEDLVESTTPAATQQRHERQVLPPVSSPSAPVVMPDGFLTIGSIPWGNVWLDDTHLGQTPIVRRPVSPGVYRLKVVCGPCSENAEQSQEITVEPGTQHDRIIVRFN